MQVAALFFYKVRFIGLFLLYSNGTNTKEVTSMITSAICRYLDTPAVPRPGAATRRQLLRKLIDHLLIMAICAGVAACAVFLTLFF